MEAQQKSLLIGNLQHVRKPLVRTSTFRRGERAKVAMIISDSYFDQFIMNGFARIKWDGIAHIMKVEIVKAACIFSVI